MSFEKNLVIKPIIRKKFSGISSYSKTATPIEGACLGKEGFYLNGLTASECEEWEKKLNLPKSTLNRKSPYWGTILKLKLKNDGPTNVALAGEEDELRYKVILNHPKIANSVLEIGKNPEALFYIDDPETDAEKEAQILDYEYEAYEKLMDTSVEEKRGLLRLYSRTKVHEMSEKRVKAELGKLIKENPKDFIEKISDKNLKTRIFVEECLEIKAIVKKGTYYYNGDDMIGASLDEVISYFLEGKNQSIKLALLNKIKNYRSK